MNRMLLGVVACLFLIAGTVMGVFAIAASQRASSSTAGSTTVVDPEATKAAQSDSSGWLKEYTLTERSGKKFRSNDLKGEVHVVNFFFTTCPTVCRIQTGAVQALQKEYASRGVTFLSITCDPETDTPVKLAQYAKEFDADPNRWLFLTGDLAYIRRVGAEMYFLAVDRFTHSESLVVVDGDGKIQGRFNWKDAAEVAKMKALLNELLGKQQPA